MTKKVRDSILALAILFFLVYCVLAYGLGQFGWPTKAYIGVGVLVVTGLVIVGPATNDPVSTKTGTLVWAAACFLLVLAYLWLGWTVAALVGHTIVCALITVGVAAFLDEKVKQSDVVERERVIPSNIRQAVLERDDYLWRYSGRRSQTMEIDHIIPVSQGGASTLDNLVTACRRCNRKKGGRTPEEAGMQVMRVRTRRRNRG